MAPLEGNQLLSLINRMRSSFIGRDEPQMLPLITRIAAGTINASGNIAAGAVPRPCNVVSFAISYYLTANNGFGDYWDIYLIRHTDGAVIFNSNTSSQVAGNYYLRFATTSVAMDAVTNHSVILRLIKNSTAADIQLFGATVGIV